MSKKRSQVRIYSQNDFRAANRIERIHIHLMFPDDFHLKESEIVHLERCRGAFAVMSDHFDQATRISRIRAIDPDHISIYIACKLMNDAKELFGDIIKVNKKFDRMILREKLIALAKQAEDDKDFAEARRNYMAVMKLDQLHRDDQNVVDPADLQLPDITFTSDISAIYDDAEDIIPE